MPPTLQINPRKEPLWEIIGGALTEFNTQQAGDDHGQNLCFVLEHPRARSWAG